MFHSTENKPLNMKDYIHIIMERRKIFFFVLGVFIIIGIFSFLLMPSTYTTQVTFHVEKPEYGIGEVRMKGFYWGGIKPRDFTTQIKLLRSVGMFEEAVKKAELKGKESHRIKINVYTPEKSDNIVTLCVTGPDPVKIVRLANAYVEELISNSFQYRKKMLLTQKEWLDEETREAIKNVHLTKKALNAFESEHPEISKDLTLLRELEGKQVQIEEILRDITIRYGEKYPKVAALRESLENIRREIGILRKEEEKNRLWIQQYEQLRSESVSAEKFYQDLMTLSQGMNAASDFTISNIQVIDEARVPSRPDSNISAFQTSLLLGFLLAIGLCLLLEYLDTTFNTPRDVEKCLKLPLIGHIPFIPREKKAVRVSGIPLYALRDPVGLISEVFRSMKVTLTFMASGVKPLRTILVLSTIQGEGRTFTASGLAIAFARSGKKTLLLEGDLYKSGICDEFVPKAGSEKIPHTLWDIFSGKIPIDKAIFESEVPNLSILGNTGHELNSTDLLNSEQFSKLIESLKNDFEKIIIDSPAIKSSLDAQILARNSDGAVFVIGANRAKLEDVNTVLERFPNKDLIMGVVLNTVAKKKDFDYYAVLAFRQIRNAFKYIKRRIAVMKTADKIT